MAAVYQALPVRHIYRQVDRAHREWAPAQIGFLANRVRLYRGVALHFTLGDADTRAKLEKIFGKKPKYADVPGLCRAAPPNRRLANETKRILSDLCTIDNPACRRHQRFLSNQK